MRYICALYGVSFSILWTAATETLKKLATLHIEEVWPILLESLKLVSDEYKEGFARGITIGSDASAIGGTTAYGTTAYGTEDLESGDGEEDSALMRLMQAMSYSVRVRYP